MEMATTYYFRVVPPADRLNIAIRQEDADGLLFAAAFRGSRTSLTRRALAGCLVTFPFLTMKVIGAIHWSIVVGKGATRIPIRPLLARSTVVSAK